jgi:hypothetical protein
MSAIQYRMSRFRSALIPPPAPSVPALCSRLRPGNPDSTVLL